MEKGFYKKMIPFMILMIIILYFAVIVGAEAHGEATPEGFYPRAGRIVEINDQEDFFVVQDGAGFLWEVGEVEDFQEGDIVAMIMWDANTLHVITDDAVVVCHYAGKEVW